MTYLIFSLGIFAAYFFISGIFYFLLNKYRDDEVTDELVYIMSVLWPIMFPFTFGVYISSKFIRFLKWVFK